MPSGAEGGSKVPPPSSSSSTTITITTTCSSALFGKFISIGYIRPYAFLPLDDFTGPVLIGALLAALYPLRRRRMPLLSVYIYT